MGSIHMKMMEFKQYRRKTPTLVKAIQVTEENLDKLRDEITVRQNLTLFCDYLNVGDFVLKDEYGNWNVETKNDFYTNFEETK